jgi:hypothetical protein
MMVATVAAAPAPAWNSLAPHDEQQSSCECQRDRARLLLDMSKLLSMVSAQQRAAPPKTPRRPMALAGREE